MHGQEEGWKWGLKPWEVQRFKMLRSDRQRIGGHRSKLQVREVNGWAGRGKVGMGGRNKGGGNNGTHKYCEMTEGN